MPWRALRRGRRLPQYDGDAIGARKPFRREKSPANQRRQSMRIENIPTGDNPPESLNVIIEVDVGNNRCGTAPGEPTLELAREIASHPSLNMRGLIGYEGFCQNICSFEERREKATEAMNKLVSTRDLLDDKGFSTEIVSAGGTGTHMITAEHPGVNEVEAGS